MSTVPRIKTNDWRVVKEYIRAHAKCQADVVWMVSECLLGTNYQWGEEAFGLKVGGPSNPTPDLHDHDCSGHVFSVLWLASEWSHEFGFGYIKSRAGSDHIPRSTADGYRKIATKIGRDVSAARTGDVVGFWRPLFVGVGHITLVGRSKSGIRQSQEARGEKWGVVQYPLKDVLARSSRAYIYRFTWLDLGEATALQPDPIYQHAMYLTRPLMQGEDVAHYQAILKSYLASKSDTYARALASWLTVNGIYGRTTYYAVKRAQQHLGLPATGGIDRATAAALDNL